MTGEKEVVYTTEQGDNLKPLMDKKLDDRGSYNIVLEKEGYLVKTVTYNALFDHEGKYEVHANLDLTLEPIQVGGDLSKIIDINPIYFDLNKAIIRPDAGLELDKIVKVMNENPNMVIELGSHTDSRGSDASNESLSDRRAKASAAYIAERITNPERIYGKGYGESKPNTVDASEDGGDVNQVLTEVFINTFKTKNIKSFDKYHQMNRRTEFIIIKM
jgi:outer membrane protein OmpA-like peptidoglycan-associated protein